MKELTGVFMKSVNLLMESLITDVLMKIVFIIVRLYELQRKDDTNG